MFDDTVTFFCRVGGEKASEWARCVVDGVQMAELCAESADAAMAAATDRAQLLMPLAACGGYVTPEVWKTLDEAGRTSHFTLRTGDVFVRGAVADSGKPVSGYLARHGGFGITSVAEKGAGSALHHFAVGAGRFWSQTGGVL